MNHSNMKDLFCRISSFQSLGTVDGPGVRAVVFMQGCPLSCHCCHNPETWDYKGGEEISAENLLNKILRLKGYFGKYGGVTFSGGEPLMQADFLLKFIPILKNEGIHVAIDTSGCILNDTVKKAVEMSDLILLDYKYTNKTDYLKFTGMDINNADDFLNYLYSINKPTWIRQVIIPEINDTEESLLKLYALEKKYSCIEKTELLAFRKLCIEKYKELNIPFPFEHIREATKEDIERCKKIASQC